jgi:hypothetical protein
VDPVHELIDNQEMAEPGRPPRCKKEEFSQ